MNYDNLEAVEKCVVTESEEKIRPRIAIERIDEDSDRTKTLAYYTTHLLEKEDGWELVDFSLLHLAAATGNLDFIEQTLNKLDTE